MGKIKILEPVVQYKDGKARLLSDITIDGKKETLFFEVEQQYQQFLVTDRIDAFVAALITLAMEKKLDIESEYPISEQLYYQLVNYYIPVLANNQSELHDIYLNIPTIESLKSKEFAVATGCSGGVDSFYSILHHNTSVLQKYKVTHLLFTSVGTLDNDEERVKNWFYERAELTKKTAEDLNIECIALYTNVYQIYDFPYATFCKYFTIIYASCVFAIQKLISIYYASSGFSLTDFDITESAHDCASFDLFNTFCLNNGRVQFYSTGSETGRLEKVKEICNNTTVKKYLSVCGREICGIGEVLKGKVNCSICNKCLRTMSELYALGMLEEFSEVFEVQAFLNNPDKYLAKTFAIDAPEFSNETKEYLDNKGYDFSFKYYFWRYCYFGPKERLRNIFRDNYLARKIYFALNLDLKERGFRSAGAQGKNNKKV